MPNRLKLLRDARGLTQEQVASLIGTTKQQYGRLENSKRLLAEKWVRSLARAFDVHPGEIWEEIPEGPLTERERNLLTLFRAMDEPHQTVFFRIGDALAQPVSQLKDGTGDD